MPMLLELDAIDAFYGGAHILHGVSLRIAPGEGVALVGRNGAGKSTLLKAVMDAGPRVHGAVRLDDRLLAGIPTHRRARLGLALVPEDRRMFAHLTILQTLRMAASAVPAGTAVPDAAGILARFPIIAGLAGRRGSALSGGQQQMVAVARGLAAAPRLLMLDEPTEGLAPLIVAELADRIRELRGREAPALIVAEQNLAFARALTDRVVLIDSGRIVFDGSWTQFDGDPGLARRHLAL
jgi:ABC-type branched-subunit amino acid transport system ATPase component